MIYIQCCYCKADNKRYPQYEFYNKSEVRNEKVIAYGCEICKDYQVKKQDEENRTRRDK